MGLAADMVSIENRRQLNPPAVPEFDIVVIGASAGGIQALSVVLSPLPPDFPTPVLVVQHMDPHHKSTLAGLLGRRCRLPVEDAEDDAPIAPGTVYIAQPDMHLLVRHGRLALSHAGRVHFTRPAVDLLFESVADGYGARAIGVILSGTGIDGAAGIQAIKRKGGTTVVQDPATAAHTGMPQAARATGCVDTTLPLEAIGPALVQLVTAGARRREMSGSGEGHADDTPPGGEFQALLEKLHCEYNFDFRDYKMASLERRIRARMAQVRVDSFAAYGRYLDAHPDEHVLLFNTILINVTGFFRDPEAWKALAEHVIPAVVRDAANTASIRIWSAGCSSGEETFSVAMLLAEHLGDQADHYRIKIYGTDIDEEALVSARHGIYRLEQVKDVPGPFLDRYFARDGQRYRFRRDVRRWCIFGAHNLIQAPPLSHIDLLVCRNVLIHFTTELQARILQRFHYAVRDGGFLFLGRSESLLARSPLFSPVNRKWRMFQRSPSMLRQATAVLPEGDKESESGGEAATVRRDAALPGGRAQRTLESLPSAVIVTDTNDTILTWNAAAEVLFDIPTSNARARKFGDLDVSYRVEGLRARIEEAKVRQAAIRMDHGVFTRRNGEEVHADITVAPLFEGSRLVGVLVHATDATEHAQLREQMSRIAEQHATAIEELQSTNEELETTNEELETTNEELETTNEGLQSTNEELETTVEELQAANTELATVNAELENRTTDLHRLDDDHRCLLNSLGQPVFAVDRTLTVRTWNRMTERLWPVPPEYAVGREFFSLPLTGPVASTRGPFEDVLRLGGSAEIPDVPYTLPTGEVIRVVLRLVPLRDGDGSVRGVVGTATPPVSSPS